MKRVLDKKVTGVGLGLRWDFIDELLRTKPSLDFVEISPENYMGRGGYYDDALDRVAEGWPIVTHGLTMSIGGDRWEGTLPYLFGTPANRLTMFVYMPMWPAMAAPGKR